MVALLRRVLAWHLGQHASERWQVVLNHIDELETMIRHGHAEGAHIAELRLPTSRVRGPAAPSAHNSRYWNLVPQAKTKVGTELRGAVRVRSGRINQSRYVP